MRKLLILAIPLLFGVGLLTAAVHNPDQEQTPRQAAGGAPSALPAKEATSSTTTTNGAPAAITANSPPATTTTTPKATTAATKPAPGDTTSAARQPAQAVPILIECGTGSAYARVDLVPSRSGDDELAATVVNEATKAIELDALVVRAVYSSGAKEYRVAVAGTRVEARPNPSEASFSIPVSGAAGAPDSFEISEFRFHTAGLPECASAQDQLPESAPGSPGPPPTIRRAERVR